MPKIKLDVGEPIPQMDFVPSEYQEAIFDWIRNGTGSAIIEAVAGSGKTTTIVKALDLIPEDESAIFMAFNKAIADELKMRVPAHATAATFHSAGFKAWRRNHNCKLDDRKVWKILREKVDDDLGDDYGSEIVHLVGLAKQAGVGILIEDEIISWSRLVDHFQIDIEADWESDVIQAARTILTESNLRSKYTIDFNDMIYMPVLEGCRVEQYDWVFIDEAQDTNGVRRELAKKMLTPGGRMVAVGDPHQAIYGFTGADSDAIDLIRDEFDCITLSLSICYRSAKSIVETARRYVPGIEASNTAPEGIVMTTNYIDTEPIDGDVILCRNTAPLINLAYEMISNGKGCKVMGRDIGKGLVKLVKDMRVRNVSDLIVSLGEYCESETRKLLKREKEARVQALTDKVDCIFAVISNLPADADQVEDVIDRINDLFAELNGHNLLTLSTIHKAKGREWDRVFIHAPSLMPSKWAKASWQMVQEQNLIYVAVTRAKRELYYVEA